MEAFRSKVIKFTPALVEGLYQESSDLAAAMERVQDAFFILSSEAKNMHYLSATIDPAVFAFDLFKFGCALLVEGTDLVRIFQYQEARAKFRNALFVAEELEREMYYYLSATAKEEENESRPSDVH